MKNFIHALPATLAFVALAPLFAVVTIAFSKMAFSTGVPAAMLSESFAILVFDGITCAAAFFAVSLFSLVTLEL